MKKLYFLFTCIMFLSGVARAQCPSGDYAIVNTEDVDDYIQHYGTCTTLPGRLRINNIQDLSFLSNVTSVAGELQIANSPGLTLLTGLENLTSIGGNLWITDLPDLTDLDALSGLANTGGNLSLYNLPEVTNLDGLSGLTSIGGGLSIEQLPLITNLNGLSGLTSVGSFINVVYNGSLSACKIDIMCEKFTDGSIPVVFNGNASGCNSLSEVGTACNIPSCPTGDLTIASEDDIDNYNALYSLCTALPGSLYISNITDLSFLNNVTTVAGNLVIEEAPGLVSLAGLDNLVSTGGTLSLYSLPALQNLDGLSGLTSIGGGLSIEQLPLITNLNALSGLTSVGSFINVVYNESLSACKIDIMCEKFTEGSIPIVINGNAPGCKSLSELAIACNTTGCPIGNITIDSEDDIDNYNALYSLCTALPGSLTIKNITDLSFLNNVTTVAGNLVIEEAPGLVSLAGLDNLVSTGGTLSLYSLPVLQNLDGLSGLTSIGGGLSIDRLPLITNLNGLSGLTSVGSFINVVYNESLSACNIAIICEKFADGSIPIGFRGNAPGCNNESVVANACNTANCPAGDITIASEDDIDNYNTLYSLCTALPGSLYISNITDLSFLNNVTSVAGNLVIEEAPGLVSLAGLDNLVSVGGALQLDNIGIADTEQLMNLTSVGGTLSFQSLPALQNLTGLSGLTAVRGSLSIDDNDLLTDISGLSNIISVGGSLSVNNNSILPGLTGLGAVATVDGALSVFNNPLLANLDALSGLQALGGDLALGNLPLITSLNGLANIGSLVGQVVIVNNPLLTTCAIQPICDRLEADGSTSFTVFNNATGCNDTDEIEVDCLALPVTLVNFEAVIADDGVLLTWRTTMETNSEHFEVQRSVNAKAWSVAGIVQARGESQDVIPYSFKDQPVYDGLVYYRLKMVDLDSGFAYSPIVSVAVHSDGIVLFPNPAGEVLNIRNGALHAIRRISVTDLSGIMLYVSDKPVSSIPLKGYKPGLYLITITYEGGEIHQKKILVSR